MLQSLLCKSCNCKIYLEPVLNIHLELWKCECIQGAELIKHRGVLVLLKFEVHSQNLGVQVPQNCEFE